MGSSIIKTVQGLPTDPKVAYETIERRLGNRPSVTIEAEGRKLHVERSPAKWFWGDEDLNVYIDEGGSRTPLLRFTKDNTFYTDYSVKRFSCVRYETMGCSSNLISYGAEELSMNEEAEDLPGEKPPLSSGTAYEFVEYRLTAKMDLLHWSNGNPNECDWLEEMQLQAMAILFNQPIIASTFSPSSRQ